MTKKHYIAVAAMIHDEVAAATVVLKIKGSTGMPQFTETMKMLERIAVNLAVLFANDNPRFDRERFLTACGL